MEAGTENLQIERSTFIGGSDAGVVCGVNPYKTPLNLWLEKTGQAEPFEGNRFTEWGNRLEEVIVDAYEDESKEEVFDRQKQYVHPDYSFIRCHIDGRTDKKLIEAKNASTYVSFKWGEAGTDQIPDEYLIQTQHNMACMGLDVADVPVLLGGNDFRIYTVHANEKLQKRIIEKEVEFWEKVQSNEMPEAVNVDDLKIMYTDIKDEIVTSNDDILEMCMNLELTKTQLKDLEESKSKLELEIKKYIGDKNVLQTPEGKVLASWKETKGRQSFDKKGLMNQYPDIYNKFTYTGKPNRSFLLKKIGA